MKELKDENEALKEEVLILKKQNKNNLHNKDFYNNKNYIINNNNKLSYDKAE